MCTAGLEQSIALHRDKPARNANDMRSTSTPSHTRSREYKTAFLSYTISCLHYSYTRSWDLTASRLLLIVEVLYNLSSWEHPVQLIELDRQTDF